MTCTEFIIEKNKIIVVFKPVHNKQYLETKNEAVHIKSMNVYMTPH